MATLPTSALRRIWRFITPRHIQTIGVIATVLALLAGDAPARITMAVILVLLHVRLQQAMLSQERINGIIESRKQAFRDLADHVMAHARPESRPDTRIRPHNSGSSLRSITARSRSIFASSVEAAEAKRRKRG